MPDFTAHYIFGQKILEKLHTSDRIPVNLSAFNLGLQGPDILYYHQALSGKSALYALGSQMHAAQTKQLFQSFWDLVRKAHDPSSHFFLKSYFYGFLCHYYLDMVMHPYIFYQEEKISRQKPQKSSGVIHAEIENILDSNLYHLFYHQSITNFAITDAYTLAPEIIMSISQAYVITLKEVYGETVSIRAVSESFRDTLRLNRLFYDKTGFISLFLAKTLEKLLGRDGKFSCHIKRKTEKTSYLNLNKNEWYNLWHPEVKLQLSVPELWQIAFSYALESITQYENSLLSQAPISIDFSRPFNNGNSFRE